jgi:ABC-type proline/glycine betaine transport system substrate-binding protein
MSFLSNPELGGMTHADAAAKWLADNEDVWMPWTSAGM